MRSGSHVQLAALLNRDLKLQTTSPFSNHGSVERSTACCHHKNVLRVWVFQKLPFFVSSCTSRMIYETAWNVAMSRCFLRNVVYYIIHIRQDVNLNTAATIWNLAYTYSYLMVTIYLLSIDKRRTAQLLVVWYSITNGDNRALSSQTRYLSSPSCLLYYTS
jgi:hypothetical protein